MPLWKRNEATIARLVWCPINPIPTKTIKKMAKRVYTRAYASVRFLGQNLDPLIVTLALQLPPDLMHRNGEPRLVRTKRGKVEVRSPHRGGLWSMSSEKWVQSPRLAIHLEWLLEQLEPKSEAVAQLLSQYVEADFFCYSLGTTPALPSVPRSIRSRIERLGVKLDIDHYCVPADEG